MFIVFAAMNVYETKEADRHPGPRKRMAKASVL
jgi:hypothetical protein